MFNKMMRQPNCLLSCIVRTRFTFKKKNNSSVHIGVNQAIEMLKSWSFPSGCYHSHPWHEYEPELHQILRSFGIRKDILSLEIFH